MKLMREKERERERERGGGKRERGGFKIVEYTDLLGVCRKDVGAGFSAGMLPNSRWPPAASKTRYTWNSHRDQTTVTNDGVCHRFRGHRFSMSQSPGVKNSVCHRFWVSLTGFGRLVVLAVVTIWRAAGTTWGTWWWDLHVCNRPNKHSHCLPASASRMPRSEVIEIHIFHIMGCITLYTVEQEICEPFANTIFAF